MTSAEEDALARRVFLTYRRVGDPGEPNAPSLLVRSRIVHDRDLVDPPKTLDLCALYAPDNPEATEATLTNLAATHDALCAFTKNETRRHETLGDKFASAGAAIAANLEQMADRVVASKIDEVPLSHDSRTDALKYFHDVAASLAALARHAPALARRCKGDAAAEETAPKSRTSKSTTTSMPKNATAGSEDTTTPLVEAASLNDSKGKGKAPAKPEILSLPDTLSSGELGFVTCAPEALCDALERVARETCDALRLSQKSASSSSSFSSDAIPRGKADAADAVRLAVLRGRDALLALDDARKRTKRRRRRRRGRRRGRAASG